MKIMPKPNKKDNKCVHYQKHRPPPIRIPDDDCCSDYLPPPLKISKKIQKHASHICKPRASKPTNVTPISLMMKNIDI